MKYRSNKIKIILTLIILVLFAIPINAKAEETIETTLYDGPYLFSKIRNTDLVKNATYFGPGTKEEFQAAIQDDTIIKRSIGPKVNEYNTTMWLTSDNRVLYYSEADVIYFNEDSSLFFTGWSKLETIDLRNIRFDKVTNATEMFSGCSSLKRILGHENFNLSNVTSFEWTFRNCSSLENLDVSNWDVSSATNMELMFNNCSSLTELDVSNWDVSNVKIFLSTFSGCSGLTELDVSKWDTSNATSIQTTFAGCSNLEYIDVSNWDTSNVTSMSFLFQNCSKLKSIDLSNFDTRNIIGVDSMFENCSSLTSLDISNFDTRKVKYFSNMFSGCTNLTNLNLGNMKVYNGTGMRNMFKNCSSLEKLDLSSFDTNKVTDMFGMFEGMTNLKELDIRNFDTSSVTTMSQAFFDMPNLERVYVSELFSTDKVGSGYELFRNNTKLIGEKGTTFNLNYIKKTYARIDDPENGNPGYFTYGEYKPKIYYPDGTFEEVELGYLFTFPDSYQKDDEVAATVNFHYHDGVTPSETSTVMKQSTFNNWKVNDDTYEPGDTLTINIDTYLEAEYTEVLTGAEFPEDPTLENNTFLGWFDEINGGNQYTSYNEEKDIDLYAQWESTIIDDNLNIEYISVTGGSLDPSFDNDREFYSLRLNNDFKEEDKLIINVQPESVFTTVVGNGQIDISQNTFTVTLTSEAGNTRVVSFDLIQNIRIEKDNYNLDEGETENIVVTYPSDTSELNVSVENKDIADINNFVITAIETGRTTARLSLKNDDSIYRDIIISVGGNELKSYIYEISGEENKQILGAKARTKVIDFKNNLQNDNDQLKIYDNDTLLTDNDLVKTGSTVKLVINDEEKDMATIIVKGDINKDGKVNIEDEAMLFDYVNLNKELTTYQMYAADVSNDNLVDQNDITKLHDYLLLRNTDINKNKVIIDPNGGVYNESSEVQEITENEETTEIGIPTKEGYTFNGWKLIGSGEITNNPPVDTINQTYTFGDYNGKLKATYIAPKNIKAYDVTGETNYTLSNNQLSVSAGSGDSAGTISFNIELDTNEIIDYTYYMPARTGGGFSINDGETRIYNKTVSGPSSGSNSGDGSYTYEGSKKILKFYFNGNGGTFNIKIKSKNGATYLLKSNSVAVGYSTNGGTISEGGCTGTTICSLRQVGETYGTLPTISKTGYTFNGWYLNSDFSGDKVTESTIVSKTTNHNLYAKFTINSYTLTINANGGTYSGTNPITQNYNTTATISKPTRSNYLFNGWSKSGAGSITNNESANQTFTFGAGNATITANWMSNKKTVSGSNLNVSGSTVSSSACTLSPSAQLTLLPGESATYYVVGSSGTMGGGGGSFSVDNDTKCSTSSSNSCSGTWKNTTSSNQTIKIGIGCSNATASFSLSDVKTRYGETYTLTK